MEVEFYCILFGGGGGSKVGSLGCKAKGNSPARILGAVSLEALVLGFYLVLLLGVFRASLKINILRD